MAEGLADKKRRAQTTRSMFTRHINSLRHHLDRWRENPLDCDLEKVIKESLVVVRSDSEQVLNMYDLIEVDEDVAEQLFTSTFKPRMVEIVKNLEEIESLNTQMTARCRDAREQAAKEQETRDH